MQRLLEGRRLFQCGYPEVRRLLEGDAYLRPDAYQRKYINFISSKDTGEECEMHSKSHNIKIMI